jgi:hypothetical protein
MTKKQHIKSKGGERMSIVENHFMAFAGDIPAWGMTSKGKIYVLLAEALKKLGVEKAIIMSNEEFDRLFTSKGRNSGIRKACANVGLKAKIVQYDGKVCISSTKK